MLPAAFIGVGATIAFGFGYLQATVVTGSEFDNVTWTKRDFWYRRDPFSGAQLTGILREPPTSLSTKNNFPNSYFIGTSNVVSRWDLIELKSGTVVTEGPANVLYSYFKPYEADLFWENWSTNNPLKANELWSAARDLVDLELYYELPKIMQLAKVESTDAEFKTLIYERMHSVLKARREQLKTAEKTKELSLATTIAEKYLSLE